MRLDLTEVLTCPDCGPEFGLIAFVDRLEEGYVVSGRLDCPQCEARHVIHGRVLTLASTPVVASTGRESSPEDANAPVDASAQSDLAVALLGTPPPAGPVLVAGCAPGVADRVAAATGAAVVEYRTTRRPRPATGRCSVVEALSIGAARLPIRTGSLAAVVLGEIATVGAREASRVLREAGRAVRLAPASGTAPWTEAPGLDVLAADPRALVAVRVARPGGGA